MRVTLVSSAIVHLFILFGVGYAMHKPLVVDDRGVLNAQFFDKAMKDEAIWEKRNNHRYSGYEDDEFTTEITKLKRDLMDCAKVRDDAESFEDCTTEISKDYKVLQALEAQLKRDPRKI